MTHASIDDNPVGEIRRVYFVGAGISANPPTGFPLARTLISQILSAISPDRQTLDLLETLADANRESKRNTGDYVRFELLLDIIQQLVDSELFLLRFVELFRDPNALHDFLAQRAIYGDIVITTNFDCLIEESIRKLGSQPVSICTIADFESWKTVSSERVPVFKIHGSYSRYDGSVAELSLETVQATLSALTMGVKDLVLPEAKREWLMEVTRGKSIVVCGYSGGDDLDIIPTFKFLSPRSVDWLLHNRDRRKAYDITEQYTKALPIITEEDLSPRDVFLREQLLQGSYPVKVYEVNTLNYLLRTRHQNLRSSPDSDEAIVRLARFIKEWGRTFLLEPHLKHLVAGHILFSLTRFQESYDCYRKAWDLLQYNSELSDSADVARMISRIAVEISRFKEAEEWSQKSDDLSSPGSSSRAKSLQQHGFAYYKLGKFSEALRCYEEAATICKQRGLNRFLSYVLHGSALIYQELSQLRKAIPLYKESIDLSSQDGDIRHVMFSYHQLGTAFFDLGEFAESGAYHLKALELARVLGDYAQIENSEHELGMLDFMAGRLLESIRRFRHGIAIASKTGRSQFVAMDLQHIGISLMEAGKLHLAGRVFAAAKQAYEYVHDEITLCELQSYLCEYDLLVGDHAAALMAAESGYAMASRFRAQEFQTRAAFMIGLTLWTTGDKVDGSRRMCDALSVAKQEEFKALLLDQVYLCARFSVANMTCAELPSFVRWAISIYAELGNQKRRQILEKFLNNV